MSDFRLVTPHSLIEIKVLSKQTLKSDGLIGSTKLDFYELLKSCNGTCKHIWTLFSFSMFLIVLNYFNRLSIIPHLFPLSFHFSYLFAICFLLLQHKLVQILNIFYYLFIGSLGNKQFVQPGFFYFLSQDCA